MGLPFFILRGHKLKFLHNDVLSLRIWVSKQCKPRGNTVALHLGLHCFVIVPIIDFHYKKGIILLSC